MSNAYKHKVALMRRVLGAGLALASVPIVRRRGVGSKKPSGSVRASKFSSMSMSGVLHCVFGIETS